MKEVVVISGKGGTGKTSITAAFSVLAGEKAIIADCDVDAADMHLMLDAKPLMKFDFLSGEEAVIDQRLCTSCGICKAECRFMAIEEEVGQYIIDPIRCEGCGLCARLCPESAITMKDSLSGEYYISETRLNTSLVHARLAIGASNSGKLVSVVKETAKKYAEEKGTEIVLVDGSPGIGCPVISSLSGASYILLVTEPSQSAFSDLKRILSLINKFNLPAACIINKSDLNVGITADIESYLASKDIVVLEKLPYTRKFSDAISEGRTIVETDNGHLSQGIRRAWKNMLKLINLEEL